MIGDSLSAGYGMAQEDTWVALLRKRLKDEGYGYEVVNASISGDTTTGGLRRLPRALEQHRPAVVVIELGGNDGLRATPVPVVRDNLARMIELSREAGAKVVLAGMQIPGNYGGTYTRAFAAAYRSWPGNTTSRSSTSSWKASRWSGKCCSTTRSIPTSPPNPCSSTTSGRSSRRFYSAV